jgi:hypothetical protein
MSPDFHLLSGLSLFPHCHQHSDAFKLIEMFASSLTSLGEIIQWSANFVKGIYNHLPFITGHVFHDSQQMSETVNGTKPNVYAMVLPVHTYLWQRLMYKLGTIRNNKAVQL